MKMAFVLAAAACIGLAACPLDVTAPNGAEGATAAESGGIKGIVTLIDATEASGVTIVAERQTQGKTARVWRAIGSTTLSPSKEMGTQVFSTLTDRNGAFSLPGLPEGEYTVTASLQNTLGSLCRGITVSSKVVIEIRIVLTPTGSISGKVTVNGIGAMGSFAYLEGTSYIAATSTDGSFTIDNVPVGTYGMAFYHEGYGSQEIQGVAVKASKTTTLALVNLTSTTGAVSGVVRLSDGADPMGILVGLAGTSFLASTDASGGFLIGGVAPATYTLSANRAGYEMFVLPGVTVAAGQEKVVEDLMLLSLNAPSADAPTFAPPEGTYGSDIAVSIGSTTSGAVIRFTTDGSDPTAQSPICSGPVAVSGDGTTIVIKAFAALAGLHPSSISHAAYRIDWARVATPVLTPAPAEYPSDQNIRILCSTTGAEIHYTIDGTEPTAASAVYQSPIPVEGDGATRTIRAVAVKSGMKSSFPVSGTYTIRLVSQEMSPVTVSPNGYSGSLMQLVSLACQTPGVLIHYTLDGSEPTRTNGTLYTGPIGVYASAVLKALAFRDGLTDSAVAQAVFAIAPAMIATQVGDYPNWQERCALTYINLARMAPQEYKTRYLGWSASDPGLSTWTATHPLYWHYELSQAARFHDQDMIIHGYFGHDSYDHTSWTARVASFFPAVALTGENMASYPSVWQASAMLMDERQYPDTPFSNTNGHRYNAMNPQNRIVGVGCLGGLLTEDFAANTPASTPPVPSACHDLIENGSTTFWMSYHDQTGQPPLKVILVLDGAEYLIPLDTGTASEGTYKLLLPRAATTRSYFFLVVDGASQVWRYPGPGVFRTIGEGTDTTNYVAP